MYTIKGTLTLLLGDERGAQISIISTGLLIITALALALLWRGRWRPHAPDFDARLALTLVVGLLITTHLNAHDALLVVLPAFLFYRYLRERDRPTRAYAAFVLSCPLLFLVSEATIGASLGVRVPFLAMLVLAGWIAWALAQEHGLAGVTMASPDRRTDPFLIEAEEVSKNG